jgi:hypothetical protein
MLIAPSPTPRPGFRGKPFPGINLGPDRVRVVEVLLRLARLRLTRRWVELAFRPASKPSILAGSRLHPTAHDPQKQSFHQPVKLSPHTDAPRGTTLWPIAKSQLPTPDFCSCRACKPNFVCRRSGMTVIPLGRALLRGSSDLPGSCDAPSRHVPAPKRVTPPLFGLAPCGVCPATAITDGAVRSYRTFSPLPAAEAAGGMFSVALSVNGP